MNHFIKHEDASLALWALFPHSSSTRNKVPGFYFKMRPCISVTRSVCPSISPFIRPLVRLSIHPFLLPSVVGLVFINNNNCNHYNQNNNKKSNELGESGDEEVTLSMITSANLPIDSRNNKKQQQQQQQQMKTKTTTKTMTTHRQLQ